jgi:hypothetical protein
VEDGMRAWVCALAFAFAAPAWAQDPTTAPGAIATNLIQDASAQGVFEPVSSGQVTLRHIGSGLVCHFARDGAGARLVLYAGLPRGDNVSCDAQDGRTYVTLYATRFPFRTTLAEQVEGAEAAIRQRFPDAQALPQPAEANPARRTIHFIVTRDGERVYTSASIAQVGDWIIKLRYSERAADGQAALTAEAAANRIFEAALAEMVAPPNL